MIDKYFLHIIFKNKQELLIPKAISLKLLIDHQNTFLKKVTWSKDRLCLLGVRTRRWNFSNIDNKR